MALAMTERAANKIVSSLRADAPRCSTPGRSSGLGAFGANPHIWHSPTTLPKAFGCVISAKVKADSSEVRSYHGF